MVLCRDSNKESCPACRMCSFASVGNSISFYEKNTLVENEKKEPIGGNGNG